MLRIEKRIAALEATATADTCNLTVVEIFPKDGESADQAIKQAGYKPDAPNSLFVCMVALKR